MDFSDGPIDLESLRLPAGNVPDEVLEREQGTSVDVVPADDLNNGLADCTFHQSYCLQKYGIAYGECLIACPGASLAYISYKRKGVCA